MRIINKHIIFLVSIGISFGSFVFGYSLVAISMMADIIFQNNSVSEEDKHYQLAIITTLLPIGGFLGSFLTQTISSRLGERKSMVFLDLFAFFLIAYQANNIDLPSLYAGRFLLGVYFGILGSIIPAYLVSMSPPEMTGLVGSFNQLLLTLGISVAYKLGMMENVEWTSYMQFPAYFCLLRIACLLFFKFDTLERHHKQNQHQKLQSYVSLFYENGTIQGLRKIRKFTIQTNANEIKIKVETTQRSIQKIVQRFTSGIPKQVAMLAFVIAIANQLSGINAIIFYAKQLFEQVSDSKTALKYTYYLGVLQVVVTFFSGFLINNYGRRTLMLFGQSIVVFSLITAYFCESLLTNSQQYITGLIFLHLIGFSLSLGPVCMIYLAQIMENINFVIIILWILTILVSLLSEIMIAALGIGKVFLFYGIVSLFCLIYMKKHMVESKGLSRQDLVHQIERKEFLKVLEEEKAKLRRQIEQETEN